jgi:hypothetical protein
MIIQKEKENAEKHLSFIQSMTEFADRSQRADRMHVQAQHTDR